MYGNLPPETLAELLLFLNEHEAFESLKQLGTVSREEMSSALEALALQLKKDAAAAASVPDFSQMKELKRPHRQLLSSLSPRESRLLLKGFNN